MKRIIWIILALIVFGFLGWLVYLFTDSTTAAYIVSCAGTTVSVAGIIISLRRGNGINSSVKINKVGNADVAGVSYSGSDEPPSVKANVEIDSIKSGSVTGVRWTKRK